MSAAHRKHGLHPATRDVGTVVVLKILALTFLALMFAPATPVTELEMDRHILHGVP